MNTDRIQATPQNLFQDTNRWQHNHRSLIFWYDPDRQFPDTFTDLELPNVEKITLGDIPFTTKYQILIQQPHQNFLLYAPFPAGLIHPLKQVK